MERSERRSWENIFSFPSTFDEEREGSPHPPTEKTSIEGGSKKIICRCRAVWQERYYYFSACLDMYVACGLIDFPTRASLNTKTREWEEDARVWGREVGSVEKPLCQPFGIRECVCWSWANETLWKIACIVCPAPDWQSKPLGGGGPNNKRLVVSWQQWVEEAKVELADSPLRMVRLEGSQEGLLKGSIIWSSIKERPCYTVWVGQGSSDHQKQTTKVFDKEEAWIWSPSYLPQHTRGRVEPRKQETKEVSQRSHTVSTLHSKVRVWEGE